MNDAGDLQNGNILLELREERQQKRLTQMCPEVLVNEMNSVDIKSTTVK